MNQTPPTLKETAESMDVNLARAQEQLSTITASGVWKEGSQDRSSNVPDVVNYQKEKFKTEIAGWRKQGKYWRDLLNRFPELADKPASVALEASSKRRERTFYPEVVDRPEPEPNPVEPLDDPGDLF